MTRTVSVRFLLGAAFAAVTLSAGCGGRDEAPAEPREGARAKHPPVVELLQLMPESAVTAVATPSLRELEDRVEDFLLRASPESINMEAEIRVVIQQVGMAVGVPGARSLDDIAFECGIDSERPFAVYFAADRMATGIEETKAAEEDPDLEVQSRAPLSPYPAAESLDGVALAAYVLDAAIAEASVIRVLGGPEFVDGEAGAHGIRVRVTKDNEWAYLIHDGVLVAGGYETVREIIHRFGKPADVRYGAEDCPAGPADCLVQLTRLDLVGRAQGVAQDRARAALPEQFSAPLSDVLWNAQALVEGPDPLISICRVSDDLIEVLTRLDREQHPAVAEWRGTRRGLPHLAMLPDDTVAVLSWDFGGTFREMTLNALGNALQPDGPAANLLMPNPATLRPLLESLDGAMTIGVSRPAAGEPGVLVLADVADGGLARTQLRASGLMPLVSETYNGTDICVLPVPIPIGEGICYAIPKSTFVLSTSLGRLKSAIDAIDAARTTGWAAKQSPPLDPAAPLLTALAVQPGELAAAFAPQLGAQARGDANGVDAAGLAGERIREVRYTTRVNGVWHEGLLTIAVK